MADRGLIFEQVKLSVPDSNGFDLSFENKLTANIGDLVPVMVQECLPGDNYVSVSNDVFCRLAPMLAPSFQRMDLFVHSFFVPARLIWDDADKFFSPGDGTQTMAQAGTYTPPVKPYFSLKSLAGGDNKDLLKSGCLWDYLGLPSIGDTSSTLYPSISASDIASMTNDVKIDTLPFRAYQLIYNEYFRDQNLTEPVEISLSSGAEGSRYIQDLLTLRKRAYEKDYFTSSLPTPQRGADVILPLTGNAPVYFDLTGRDFTGWDYVGGQQAHLVDDTGADYVMGKPVSGTRGSLTTITDSTPEAGMIPAYADLSQVSAINVESLRESMFLQEFLEKSARSGSRIGESNLAHFGVQPDDVRNMRPEYLGGGKQPVVISEIAQTSASDVDTTPLASLAGKGISGDSTNEFSYFCKEHGFIISILSVRPRTSYCQGISKKFSRFDMYDYAFPEFAHLGEQPVYNQELYLGADNYNESVFGYQSRYAEYKYNPDEVHGDFRTNLNYWHLGRQFDSRPGLNTGFIEVSDVNRIFAVTDDNVHHLYIDVYNNVYVTRKLPKFAVPHF